MSAPDPVPPADSYPRESARTQRYTLGEPRDVVVSPDGSDWGNFGRKITGTKSGEHVFLAGTKGAEFADEVAPRPGDPDDLENAILTVRRTAIDGEVAERVTGEILAIDPAPRTLRAKVPVLSMPNGGAHAR